MPSLVTKSVRFDGAFYVDWTVLCPNRSPDFVGEIDYRGHIERFDLALTDSLLELKLALTG